MGMVAILVTHDQDRLDKLSFFQPITALHEIWLRRVYHLNMQQMFESINLSDLGQTSNNDFGLCPLVLPMYSCTHIRNSSTNSVNQTRDFPTFSNLGPGALDFGNSRVCIWKIVTMWSHIMQCNSDYLRCVWKDLGQNSKFLVSRKVCLSFPMVLRMISL